MTLNAIDGRKETTRYSCLHEDLDAALSAARFADVTVQEIVTVGHKNERHLDLGSGATATVSECVEEYPVLHLASHGKKWEPAAIRRAKEVQDA